MSSQQGLRGLSTDREISGKDLYRDIRTPGQKVADFFSDQPLATQIFSGLLVVPVFISPTFFMLVCLPLIYWLTSHPLSHRQTLPLLLPSEAKIEDQHDPKPGRWGNFKARGRFLVGNIRFSRRPYELWLSFNHLLTHLMLLGSTGAGKTETLVSMAANYLAVGSGTLYSDAKAAPKLGWQIYSLTRYFGRDDDFRALNYIKGNTSEKKDPAVRYGNNVNLFAYGSAESAIQIIVSIMPPGGGENKLFSERAIGLISAVLPGLVDLRDKAGLLITPGVIRKALELTEVEKLRDHPKLSAQSREAIRSYLASLPGYSPDPGVDARGNKKRQPEEVGRQFGFAQAYFTRSLAALSDTYGDIYMTGRGEINFLDMVLRRRIGVVMIPALEKAPEEMKNLAKIVLAAQKNAVSTGIPPAIEGRKEDVLEALPTSAPVPYSIINDEFAFMMTSGYGVMLAQARGLYVAVTIAGQDYAGMMREDADEAEQIAENTKIKIVMASEGLGKTAELLKQVAGEGMAMAANSFSMEEGSMSGTYRDSRSASVERRSRIDTMDTRSQVEGEGIIFWRDKIVPVNMFFHGMDDDTIVGQFAVHRMLDVNLPTRGYGASLFRKKGEYHSAIEKALASGLYLSREHLELPPDLEFLGAARDSWKVIADRHPDLPPQIREGLLYGALMATRGEDLVDTLTEQSAETSSPNRETAAKPASESPRQAPVKAAQVAAAPDLHAEPEPTSAPIHDEPALDEPDWDDEDDPFDATPDPDARQKEITERLGGIQDSQTRTILANAPWTLDASLLKATANRDLSKEEEKLALRTANNVARIERATGTKEEDAMQVGLATAHTVLRGIEYPSNDSHSPETPKSDTDRKALIDRTTSALENWLNAGDEHDDSLSER